MSSQDAAFERKQPATQGHSAWPIRGIFIELTVDLSVNLEREVLEREVAQRSIDLVLQSEPFLQEFSMSNELGKYPLIWVAAPESGLH